MLVISAEDYAQSYRHGVHGDHAVASLLTTRALRENVANSPRIWPPLLVPLDWYESFDDLLTMRRSDEGLRVGYFLILETMCIYTVFLHPAHH